MLCTLKTATLVGINALPVEVQVDVSGGLPGFHLVGLPNGAVREGSVRIRAALANSNYNLGSMRVTVNLAPADLRKDGAAFDLPIALGALGSRQLIEIKRHDLLIAGELALDGRLLPIRGALSLAESARRQRQRGIVLPRANAAEAALVEGIEVYGAESLQQAVQIVVGQYNTTAQTPARLMDDVRATSVDFAEVYGQQEARRAAEIAAAGGHNLMLIGPPGAGKTMVARRLGTILPTLSRDEAIETTKVHSVAGLLDGTPLVLERPFRAPHHTCSSVGLIGGGTVPRPGEVSLAHNGVLFLDELPEFQRGALEALRQPLEDAHVTIVRARQVVTFPARFMVVAAMNPCPCGFRGSTVRTCTCGEREATRYRARISGPLLDRFDIFVRVSPVPASRLLELDGNSSPPEGSTAIAARVAHARQRQRERFARCRIHCNAQMSSRQVRRYVQLSQALAALVERYATRYQLSARALHRSLRVARTLADLDDHDDVADEHVLLALTLQQARWLEA